ncbi:MAG: fibro-slime domain-containing protein, partial [Deltaproteobacteria bacterium]
GGSGGTGGTGGDPCNGLIPVRIRDFHASHPDFESYIGSDPGIVQPDLGPNKKPVYAGQAGNPSTSGQANFDQWYNDVPGVNFPIDDAIQLTETMPGQWVFDDQSFFPIDGQGFGNEGNVHNYHFTLELHTTFTYKGGEVFTFRGDDDVFVFMNGKLAIDLGGVHPPQQATIDLDAEAANLGLVVGNTYDLDLFFAERHTTQSSFRIETTIDCFLPQ